MLEKLTKPILLISAMFFAVTSTQVANAHDRGAKRAHSFPVCREVDIEVALSQGQPEDQFISGTLCRSSQHNDTVDILVHGATYNREYWDFGYRRHRYSYVRTALHMGRNVFYYDRLGDGGSSRPDSTEVTMQADAEVLKQVVDYMKNKEHFNQVNVIGHSFGSAASILAASQSNDIDRLVVTSLLQSTGPALINGELKQYPANQDPQFTGQGYDDGWLTSEPGNRSVFYDTASADPGVIAYDEDHKDVSSLTQVLDGRLLRTLPPETNPTADLHMPVLIIDGQNDSLYCGAELDCSNLTDVKAFIQPYYPNVSNLTVVTVPDTGHDINLHPSAWYSFLIINYWLKHTPVD